MQVFESSWWKATVPTGWSADQDQVCTTFSQKNGVGALQVSCARKKAGSVTWDDLQKEANKQGDKEVPWEEVHFGSLVGLSRERSEAGIFWMEWFLARENLLFLVTYNCASVDKDDAEISTTKHIVSTIDIKVQKQVADNRVERAVGKVKDRAFWFVDDFDID